MKHKIEFQFEREYKKLADNKNYSSINVLVLVDGQFLNTSDIKQKKKVKLAIKRPYWNYLNQVCFSNKCSLILRVSIGSGNVGHINYLLGKVLADNWWRRFYVISCYRTPRDNGSDEQTSFLLLISNRKDFRILFERFWFCDDEVKVEGYILDKEINMIKQWDKLVGSAYKERAIMKLARITFSNLCNGYYFRIQSKNEGDSPRRGTDPYCPDPECLNK